MSLSPPRWTHEELTEGAIRGLEIFREHRRGEAREDYTSHFEEARDAVENLLEATDDLADMLESGREAAAGYSGLEAFRYLSAPPLSTDDLISLSEVTGNKLLSEAGWPSVATVIFDTIDAHRFPWVREGRGPSNEERSIAIIATSALIASRRVMTARANEAKKAQEALVMNALGNAGFTLVLPRKIASLHGAPQPGEYCGESELGGSKADVIARLPDFRTLAIECKASNSAVNSYKRVNHEAANKAKNWIQKFGTEEIVPAAVIGGVFDPKALAKAQTLGLTLWWSHDIEQMIDWIESLPASR
ncbi:XamI family restriction endonuclease [Clavibacter sp. VKM Ac-2542]|uniref:XamI family restriction endonuclease n=1 Tax=Clavibacter sp. VKM Ac-2542 TaxID=2783811 RepID=UPI00188ACBF4|nr:XamI family restriction endonuclease [Clavibacter sp. VKM Ac-2542]MBF4622602.1 XamI family restriction endonuclease [Clavibacter sp. VKM Ac-2542]